MNLRDLVAKLECLGKPEFSSDPVMVLTEGGEIYGIKDIEFEKETDEEGNRVSLGGTVWLRVEER